MTAPLLQPTAMFPTGGQYQINFPAVQNLPLAMRPVVRIL